ncbi:efflux RND transporter periplasmic adaptor subunit [Dongshaea marina]|uniref:efflux RND transporter periplasmic adaptor subunit n=1 Tax=Dongshaea marina TaxID=2047966 RepID=UPI000D3EC43B|nr:HlyD family efflux transporter periplasmic adaptor subunit [Dongshaea marina]
MKKKGVIILVVAIVLVALITWYKFHLDAQKKPLATVVVTKGSIEETATAVGNIVPDHVVDVKSQIDGIVADIYHQVGDQVEQNTPLIKIRPNPTPTAYSDAIKELSQARSNMDAAKVRLENLKKLHKDGVIPQNFNDLVDAQNTLKTSEAALTNAKQRLSLLISGEASVGKTRLTSTIMSPVAGTIIDREAEVGDPVISLTSNQAATVLLSIADLSKMQFKGSISESDAAHLHSGMQVSLKVAAYPRKPLRESSIWWRSNQTN